MDEVLTASGGQSSHILLVEDDARLEEVLSLSMQSDNISFTRAPNGREGLRWLAQRQFDLVLLDLGLPEMDGFEFLEQVKPMPGHAPVIVLTARHGTEEKLRSFELGAVDYVTKPFEVLELRARVRASLRTTREQSNLADR